MTAQNTKTIQYRLRNGQSVEVTINNDGVPGEKVSISDLAIEKTIMCHLGFTEEVSKKHGVAIWRTMDTGMRRFITARTPGMTMMDLMQIANLARRPINELSGGQWQRTLIARALACDPDLLLLDEPDTHLDNAGKHFLRELLEREAERRTLVMVSHDTLLGIGGKVVEIRN